MCSNSESKCKDAYSLLNGITANFLLHDLDLNFHGHIFEVNNSEMVRDGAQIN